jgi:ATP-dependent RNA helicase DeaD
MKLVNDNVQGKVEIGRIDLMKSFSFFEVAEEEADRVVKSLSSIHFKGRKVTVEVATGEASDSGRDSKRKGGRRDEKKGRREDSKNKNERKGRPAEKKQQEKKQKPSREERGYTAARGKKYTKDDWKQFFNPQPTKEMKGEEPDFSEEGWARRFPKK